MKINDLNIDELLKEKIISKGISELNEPQEMAVRNGLLEGKNLLISSPTASGKTLIAILAISKIMERNKKALYVVPLRSLAMEKYEQFCYFFGMEKVGVSTGDYDSTGNIGKKDIIILTVEKLDSLLRHGISWISRIELVVFDEIHLLNDRERGPTLEIVITKLLNAINFQILALSATVRNSEEIAEWLNCKLIKSNYRPVELKEGIFIENRIEFFERRDSFIRGNQMHENIVEIPQKFSDDILNITYYFKENEKQLLIFVNSRKNAENLALKISEIFEEIDYCKNLSEKILKVLPNPTEQCRNLARCVKRQTAFHHAGLMHKQRRIIEREFLNGNIRVIVATPTLAMGVSLPSYAVLVKNLTRFGNYGNEFIPVMEYRQFIGRAGRPEFHEEGLAISYARDNLMKEEIKKRYIFGDVENIYSKLAVEPILRFHLLGLISTSFQMNKEEIMDFFLKTLYFYQYRNREKFEKIINRILDFLTEYNFVKCENGSYEATLLGRRTSELYLDPESALKFLNYIHLPYKDNFLYLFVISDVNEIRPLFPVRDKEIALIEPYIEHLSKFISIPEEWDYHYNDFIEKVKMAVILQNWIDEKDDNYLMEKYSISPGILRGKLELSNWLLYSMRELARIEKKKKEYGEIEKLRRRVKYGVKEELLPLVKYKGIGRVKARKLFNSGIKSRKDILKVDIFTLSGLIGVKTAKMLKELLEKSEKPGL